MSSNAVAEIISRYQQAIEDNPQDRQAHHHLAMYYAQKNDYAAASNHFKAALRITPHFLPVHYHAGLLYLKHQQQEMAKLRFLSVLELDRNHIPAHFYLGVLSLQLDELSQAEYHFQSILALNPDHVPTLINCGALALKRDAGQMAISYFTQVLVLEGDNLEARRNLAATFMHYDRFENALTHYHELKKIDRLEVDDLYNMGVATAALGELTVAINYYHQVLVQQETHVPALNNLAAIKIRLGQRAEAVVLLQRALQIDAKNNASQFMLDVLTQRTQNLTASHDYIRNLFNHYALYYEQHLQKILHYSLPQQCLEILRALPCFQIFSHVLDLGCGTGLSGLTLRDYSQHLTGVDLSAKMLTQARHKNIYDHWVEADIISFLRGDHQTYDLIQAIDVLPYFGALEELFAAIVPRLTINGIFIFSAEISQKQAWEIQDSMRFCHDADYVHRLLELHQLRQLHHSTVIARKENEQNLFVMLMVYSNSTAIKS